MLGLTGYEMNTWVPETQSDSCELTSQDVRGDLESGYEACCSNTVHATENSACNEGYIVKDSSTPIFLFLDSHQQDLYVYTLYLKLPYQADEAADTGARQ